VVVALGCAGAAVLYGLLTSRWLLAKSPGNERMQEISKAVQEGASAYLKRQYTIIGGVAVVLAVVIAIALDVRTAIGFLIGGTFSASAGFIGMNVSVRANARVAESARGGISPALAIAFKGGAVTGLLVAGLALLGVAAYYGILRLADVSQKDAVDALVGLGFGGSLISVFARLGGGIFTKAADVGADLVGKVEAGIPEDDPRNPAVIAAAAFYPITKWLMDDVSFKPAGSHVLRLVQGGSSVPGVGDFYLCTLIGIGVTALLFVITDCYTSTRFRPVKTTARASQTGHATNIIQGLAQGFQATALPAIVLAGGIIGANALAGIYGVGI